MKTRPKMSWKDWMGRGAIISHRGEEGPGIPENYLAAFSGAIYKAMPIELDVVITADKQPIVFHDSTLDRLTDKKGRVSKMTLEQIKQAKLENGELVHTLSEILEFIDGRVPVIVDLKPQIGVRGKTAAIAISSTMNQYKEKYEGRAVAQSFSPTFLRNMKKMSDWVPRGQLSYFVEDLLFLPYSRPNFLATDFKSMQLFLGIRKGLGINLVGWGITPANISKASRVFDAMISDVEKHSLKLPDLSEAFSRARELITDILDDPSVDKLMDLRAELIDSPEFEKIKSQIDKFLGQQDVAPAARDVVSLGEGMLLDLDKIQSHLDKVDDDPWFRAGQKVGRILFNVVGRPRSKVDSAQFGVANTGPSVPVPPRPSP